MIPLRSDKIFLIQFSIKVLVQMGDVFNVTLNNSTNYVYASMKIGDIIVVGQLHKGVGQK